MKRMLLVILSLIYLVSAHTFAAENKYSNLVSHKERGATNIKINFKESKSNKNIFSNFISDAKASKNFNQLIHAFTKINNITVNPLPDGTEIYARNFIFIYNASDSPQSYTIEYSACVEKLHDDGTIRPEGCHYNTDIIELDSNKMYEKDGDAQIDWYPSSAGTYYAYFGISVRNNNEPTNFVTSDYTGEIQIPAVKK